MTPPLPEPVERVSAFVRDAGAEARIQEFPEGTHTAQDAADAVGCELAQIVKSLVFICDGKPVVALVPGDRRGDAEKVAAAVEASSTRVSTLRLKKSRTCCTVVMYTTDGLTRSKMPMVCSSSLASGPRGVTARGTASALASRLTGCAETLVQMSKLSEMTTQDVWQFI